MVAGLMLVSVCGRLAALLGPAGVGRPLPGWLVSTPKCLELQHQNTQMAEYDSDGRGRNHQTDSLLINLSLG